MKVTAVLIKYHRLKELEVIIKHLETYDFIDEILIHDNTKENIMCYGRYMTAKKAKNDTIYVQDDDCIIDVAGLFKHYNGAMLVNGMKPRHAIAYDGIDSIVGWGMFFDKSWIGVLDKYIDEYGEDDVFIRESDRIFTGLLTRKTVIISIVDFPSARSSESLYRQKDHETYKQEALKRLRGLI